MALKEKLSWWLNGIFTMILIIMAISYLPGSAYDPAPLPAIIGCFYCWLSSGFGVFITSKDEKYELIRRR
jgi:hypothetical protein